MDSAAASSGLEVECSIAWASLGVPAGSPLTLHASAASGISLPGHVRDNTDPIDTQYAVAALTTDPPPKDFTRAAHFLLMDRVA